MHHLDVNGEIILNLMNLSNLKDKMPEYSANSRPLTILLRVLYLSTEIGFCREILHCSLNSCKNMNGTHLLLNNPKDKRGGRTQC